MTTMNAPTAPAADRCRLCSGRLSDDDHKRGCDEAVSWPASDPRSVGGRGRRRVQPGLQPGARVGVRRRGRARAGRPVAD